MPWSHVVAKIMEKRSKPEKFGKPTKVCTIDPKPFNLQKAPWPPRACLSKNTVGSLIDRHANDSPSICLKWITEKITLTPSQKWPSLFWVTSTKASMRTGKDSLLADFVNFQVNARKKFASTLKAGMVTSLVYATDVISVKRPTNVTRIWDLMFQPLISMFGHITSPDSP